MAAPTPFELQEFDRLSAVMADSSSLIYCRKAGFLDLLCSNLHIHTIPEVIEETGFTPSPCTVLPADPAPEGEDTDTLLLASAVTHNLPLLSEDRKLLLRGEAEELPYYNALMTLLWLLYHGKVSDSQYHYYKEQLFSCARYHARVISYADSIYHTICKLFPPERE